MGSQLQQLNTETVFRNNSWLQKIKHTKAWIKITNWEFWPFELLYFPVFFYWGWLCLKARSFFFFSASNPGIEYGGMLFESKIKILEKIPEQYKPKTLFFNPEDFEKLNQKLLFNTGFDFPLIVKPDIGERGWGVIKIDDFPKLTQVLKQINYNILIQEYIDLPLELGVFYIRNPDQENGKITSIVKKKTLSVTGDGHSQVRTLIRSGKRARLYLDHLEKTNPKVLNEIPDNGFELEIEPIGNHCRGTTFLNANNLINPQLNRVFDEISHHIEGFYFGRFDLKCGGIEDLYHGKVKIMELNGAGSEPGHIYHPGSSLKEAYKSIRYHLDQLLKVSQINKAKGIQYMSFSEGISTILELRRYRRRRNKV